MILLLPKRGDWKTISFRDRQQHIKGNRFVNTCFCESRNLGNDLLLVSLYAGKAEVALTKYRGRDYSSYLDFM